MTEVAFRNILKLVVEEARHSCNGGGFAKVELVKQAAETAGINESVELPGQRPIRRILTLGLTILLEFLRGHPPVAAIAVEEEVGAQTKVILMKVEFGM